jgi:ribosomal protein S18 acetylase RimI-like enzyme
VVRLATPADVPQLAATLARAFDDDPVARYALPSARRRPGQQRRFFAGRLRTLLSDELVFCDEERRGAALWAPPDRWRTPLSELVRTRIVTTRLPLVLAGGVRLEHRHPRDPHLYLAVLGVDPSGQGRGLGSRLLAPGLERCDAEGVPAYLESSKERNVAFYGRHGFEVTGEVRMPLGPPLWLMTRAPR